MKTHDPETSRGNNGVQLTQREDCYHIYPPLTTPFPILSPSLMCNFSKQEKKKKERNNPPAPSTTIQLFLSLLLRLLRFASVSLGLHPSHCISPPSSSAFHTHALLRLTHKLFQFNSATQCLSPKTTLLHNHCWWGFHFEQLLVSHFFSSPHSLRLLDFIDVSFACVLMIYMRAHHNKFD